ncbi:putative quinol monooxygenase [Terrimonas pollutisoli]|uniref:putative quinol monooxygenase n=1 Tax=Terrimonas pollutisoli TaxID=3034147 RepID=UPI0023EDDC00|nr:putative quinol monooxygenase [Terrimonas sp. H1YJ31]
MQLRKYLQPIFLNRRLLLTTVISTGLLFFGMTVNAQEKKQLVRLAKLQIDSAQLESYKTALREEIEASVRLEPGVLTLYAVAEKNKPNHITILEIYADSTAYKAHLQTPHFIKYKTGTKDMVKSLELVETVPLIPGMKIK